MKVIRYNIVLIKQDKTLVNYENINLTACCDIITQHLKTEYNWEVTIKKHNITDYCKSKAKNTILSKIIHSLEKIEIKKTPVQNQAQTVSVEVNN